MAQRRFLSVKTLFEVRKGSRRYSSATKRRLLTNLMSLAMNLRFNLPAEQVFDVFWEGSFNFHQNSKIGRAQTQGFHESSYSDFSLTQTKFYCALGYRRNDLKVGEQSSEVLSKTGPSRGNEKQIEKDWTNSAIVVRMGKQGIGKVERLVTGA